MSRERAVEPVPVRCQVRLGNKKCGRLLLLHDSLDANEEDISKLPLVGIPCRRCGLTSWFRCGKVPHYVAALDKGRVPDDSKK